jgi:hypothetical protein
VLEPIAAESFAQGAPGTLRTSRFHEQQSSGCDEPILSLGLGRRPLHYCRKCFKTSDDHLVIAVPRGRRFQKLDCLFDALDGDRRVSGRMTSPHQERTMACNTVANFAEPREVNEQSFLEE